MRVPINIATRPFVNLRPFLLTAGLLGMVTVVLTVLVLVVGVNKWQEHASTRAKLTQLDRERSRLLVEREDLVRELSQPNADALLQRKLFLDELVERRRLSWIELFFDLQEDLPPQVRIVSLSPTLQEGGRLALDLRVAGRSASDVISFVQALEADKKFQNVVLRSQQEGTGGGSDRLLAQLSAVYAQD
jgi:type IV pilus assembly protein PilN